ncbi:hypothetical protein ACGC1H_002052 [Rhizoctonia solani]|uniref:F-box domain-containing protein n=1 Tax=Rhizoctonia solani TaxID=456999 RepID=A0A8H3A4N7_9AGAM|nr:unnamed protein product [Rhizoctonia solani]
MSNKPALMFEDLSSEVIIQILHFCKYSTILRLAATCKVYHKLVTQSISLQLHIELEANGLELVKGSFARNATYSVILDDLKRFRKAWLDLDLAKPIVRSVGKSHTLLWELREGFYIQAFSQSGVRHADALQFVPLDSETPNPPPLLFDFPFDQFTVDPGQELIALASRNLGLFTTIFIDLCSISTGRAHSLAQCPRLTAEFDFERPFFTLAIAIEIMGNVLLTSVSHPRLHTYELLIWDWRSGNVLSRISSRQGICDFTFLDQQHLAIMSATRTEPHLEVLRSLELLVYALSDGTNSRSDNSGGQIQVADIVASQPILRLAFPPIQESSKISETAFFLQSDPTPGRIIYQRSAAFACSYTHTLSMTFRLSRVNTGWESPDCYQVFLDGRSLLEQVCTSSSTTVPVPWASWGIGATRWFLTPRRPDYWNRLMSSSRFICRLSDQPYYCILDFSSTNANWFPGRTFKSHPARLDQPEGANAIVSRRFEDLRELDKEIYRRSADWTPGHKLFVTAVGADSPSTIIGPGFEEPIMSQLQYQIVCRMNHESDHQGWQINGDCVVGISNMHHPTESLTIHRLRL